MGRAMQMNTLASRLTHVSNHYLSMCVLEGAYCNPRNDFFPRFNLFLVPKK